MADFAKAIDKVLRNEGGFADRRSTTGEVVNRGITLDTLWRLDLMPVDMERQHPASDEEVDIVRELSLESTWSIYQTEYWDHLAASNYLSQALADKVMDVHVNTGRGAFLLQRASNLIHWPGAPVLVEDGIIGQKTLAAINLADPKLLLGHCGSHGDMGIGFRGVAERYYYSIPDPAHNLEAWLDRLRRD